MKTTTALLGAAFLATAGAFSPLTAAAKPEPELIEHGRYLVHNVAGCVDCHSPRNERGEFIPDKHLTGAVLGFAPLAPMPWAPAAPSLAGLEGYTTEQGVKFLMTGERPHGEAPRPPMPSFRLKEGDARAIVAYLQSLKQT